jgi:DNA-binding transcriptional regulator YhcF (GntR family)
MWALPLHRQLYEQMSSAIHSGHLKPGTRLPSTRANHDALGGIADYDPRSVS